MSVGPSMAFSSIGWLVLLLGGFGLPVGVPPLPEDPMMANIAPEECVAYMSSAGMATPDAKSGNQTEQLLAEPEVRQMGVEIERAVRAGLKHTLRRGSLPPGVTSDDLSDAAKLLLTRPLAVYVSSVQMQPGGPIVHGGIAVNCGDKAARLRVIVEQLARTVPPQLIKEIEVAGEKEKWRSFKTNPDVALVCGFHDNYLIVTVGEGEAEALLKRATGAPPAWLTKLRQNLPVERLSTVTYVNVKAVKNVALPMAGPQVASVLKAIGLDNVTTMTSVTGLDKKGCVTKTLFGIDGEPEGVLRLADVKPLGPADLALIPHDATFALAYRLNPTELFDTILDISEKIEPRGKEEMLRGVGEMEEVLGLKLRDDVLKPLGDTWRVFDSPSEGGALAGLTLVLSLKDPQHAKATSAKLAKFIQAHLAEMEKRFQSPAGNYPPDMAAMFRGSERLETVKFAGHDIHVYSAGLFGPPFAPAWCVTEKELIVSLFPQSIKAYLSRPADFRSLTQVPEVAEALQGDAGPVKLAYGNSRRLFDVLYPVLVSNSKFAAWGLQRAGVNLSPMMLPSAGAVRPHLLPTVIAVRRTKAGIEVVEQRTLPGPSLATTVPVGVGLMFPAVHASRAAAERVQSTNNMKQIDLALLNYEAAKGAYPPAYVADKNGKPLLSWRVLILPYLEEQPLYEQFHLDEPWDSEHNKKLIDKMPQTYRSPNSTVSRQWKTNYLTVRGKDTIFSGKEGARIASITDGTSNTIMTVEVSDAKAVIWTKPDDFAYDKQNPLKGLVGLQPGGFIAGFADGSVRFLRSSISPKTLNLLFTRNDGKPVDWQEMDR